MRKCEFKKTIEDEIENGESILQAMEVLLEKNGSFMALRQKVLEWSMRVATYLGYNLSPSNPKSLNKFDVSRLDQYSPIDFCKEITRNNVSELKIIKECIPNIILNPISNGNGNTTLDGKLFKVFISHSSQDFKFVQALVNLLEFIGISDTNKLFCSSIPGYMIPNSKKIGEYLRRQFNEYNVFVIIVHSHNYYHSSNCMNEMGAVWGLGTDFCSLLVRGLDLTEMKGFINSDYTSIKVDADDAKARLNDLKDKLLSTFQLEEIDTTRWEGRRDEFLEKVNALPINCAEQEVSLDVVGTFEITYIPFLNKIFDLIDIKNYPEWMYYWACDGDNIISQKQYDNLEVLLKRLKRVDYKEGFDIINPLLRNLTQLLSDYLYVCGKHIKCEGGSCRIGKFYKNVLNDPLYDKKVNEYKEYCFLIYDLSMEMTRLLNLLLDEIRKYTPKYYNEYGIMTILYEKQEDVRYRDEEKASSPYPGLKLFSESTRFSRSKHIGMTKNIEFLHL